MCVKTGEYFLIFCFCGTDIQQAQMRKQKQDVSTMYTKCECLEFILIDEGSSASCENLGVLESNVRGATREAPETYKIRPAVRRGGVAEVRPWGGKNLLFFVDWWQLPPIMQTPIFANPFSQSQHHVSRIMDMFWNKDIDSMNAVVELTEAKRCRDPWLLAFIQECRNGKQSWEMYNAIHGFPTAMVGSWMPGASVQREYTLLCENEACYRLCDEIWPQQRKNSSPWAEMVVAECEVCAKHRELRCRVRMQGDEDKRHEEQPFTDAPYLHPYNHPRYHALLLRAVRFAQAHGRILLWYKAADRPYKGIDESLRGEALQRRLQTWLRYSDDKTAGIMGLLPLVKGMPMRCTNTIDRDGKLFKHTRCTLRGWELDPVDAQLLQKCTEAEYVVSLVVVVGELPRIVRAVFGILCVCVVLCVCSCLHQTSTYFFFFSVDGV